jgi:hypothetical protein
MGSRLRAIVETEHTFDQAVQLIRQMHRSGPPTIRASFVLELLQLNPECLAELGNGPRENRSAARRVFLDDRKTVPVSELFDRIHITGVGSELPREILPLDVSTSPVSANKLLNSFLQGVACATSQEHGHFEPLLWIGLPDGSRSLDRLPFAAFEWMSCHCRCLLAPTELTQLCRSPSNKEAEQTGCH